MFGKSTKSLADILGTFTTVKEELNTFLTNGKQKQEELTKELETVTADNTKAATVLENVNKLIGE